VQRYLEPTPLIHSPLLSERLGCEVYLKCENLQPIGAFKIRGGLYLLSRLGDDERARGVIAVSSGNHGQSVAYAARVFDTRAIVYAGNTANPYKVEAMRRLGAEVVLAGDTSDDARPVAEERAERDGLRYIHTANEPDLIAGVGTYALEIIEQMPDLDTVIVPVGAGSGVCGTAIVMKAVNPDIRVIGVQAEGMPVVERSWRARRLLTIPGGHTIAEGLAMRVAFELPLRIINELVDDIVLVSDGEIAHAIVEIIEGAHVVAEAAGAAALAGARRVMDRLAGRKVALVISGGNITAERIRWALSRTGRAMPAS
jgi:threonine dehydratase